MKRLLFMPILLLLCGIAESAPSISNYSNGVITCTDAGTHPDYNVTGQDYLCNGWDDFEDGSIDDVFTDVASDNYLTEVGVRTGSTQCVGINNGTSSSKIGYADGSTADGYYTSFWMRYPSGTTWPDVASSQNKLIRIGYTGNTNPNFTFGKRERTTANDRQHIGVMEVDNNYLSYYGNRDTYLDGEWHFIEGWLKMSTGVGNTDGEVYFRVDGETMANTKTARTDSDGNNVITTFWYIMSYVYFPSNDIYCDDVYMSETQARVMIGNDPVYADCTHLEIQPPTAWSDTSITIEQNKGSFNDGDTAYLFVVDSDGTASDGYEIIVNSLPVSPGINGAVTIKGAVTITP